MDLERVKGVLLDSYDTDELVDVLKITAQELVERFEDKVEEYALENDDEQNDEEADRWTS